MTIHEVKNSPVGETTTVTGIVRSIEEKQTPRSTFIYMVIGDKTGDLDVRVFDNKPIYSLTKTLKDNMFVTVTGTVGRFKESFSFEIVNLLLVDEKLVNLSDYVGIAPEGEAYLRAEFQRLLDPRPAELKAPVHKIMADVPEFFTAPAAFAMHHAYRHGLLEHSVHVAKIVERVLTLYPEVNPDIAIVGALLHDIGKAREYRGITP